ncbi:MAG TPA: hypothetical protein VI585_29230, partial [Candidatus Binatia bacterium]
RVKYLHTPLRACDFYAHSRSFLFDWRLKHFSFEFQAYSSYSIILILGISIALNNHTWLL